MKKITLTEKRFFEWYEDNVAVTLRYKGGSYGYGSEVLVICPSDMLTNRPERTITNEQKAEASTD